MTPWRREEIIGDARLLLGDCREILPTLSAPVDAFITDPPFFRVKDDEWDRQWTDRPAFLSWLSSLMDEFHRLLASNGSLFVFAFPDLASLVEGEIGRRFRVLNHIVWRKGRRGLDIQGWGQKTRKEDLRHFVPATERIIFAEHYGSDRYAKGEAGYAAKCDELRGFLFEPLRAYLAAEVDRSGWKLADLNREMGFAPRGMVETRYFGRSQWQLPTEAHYHRMRQILNRSGGDYLRREYEDLRREYEDLRREYEDLRREYEDLRREYEDLRRPFLLVNGDQWSDLWEFDPVQGYPGKHPCEKPLPLMEHMVSAATRDGALVCDPFGGSGTTGVACVRLGRRFIGVEKDPHWFSIACKRIDEAQRQGRLFDHAPPKATQLPLLNLSAEMSDP